MQQNEIREKKWNAAIYVRISEEERNKQLSSSIENQTSLLTVYANKKDISVYKIYEDDGYSGGSFKRPGFKRMMGDIDNGIINCVLVKDLSRFGREHIEGDYYLEKQFPQKGIRFISLHERLDSYRDPVRMNSIEIPLINIFNEQYLRQVSNATKASLKLKRKEGQFVGAIVPYGYLRSPEDKYKLIVDEKVICIVKKIFRDYITYNNMSSIANELNSMKILNSVNRRRQINNKPIKPSNIWTVNTIKAILEQQIYTGDMVQGKTYSYSYKAFKRMQLPEDKWDIVKETHEVIISIIDFEKVQKLMNKKAKPKQSKNNTEPSIFSGFLLCSDCGKKMVRSTSKSNGTTYHKFICSTYKKYGLDACSCHLIQEDVLIEIVKEALNKLVFSIIDIKKRINKATEKEKTKNVLILKNEQKACEANHKEIMNLKTGLYSDYKLGILTFDEYQEMKTGFDVKYKEMEEHTKNIERQITNIKNGNIINDKFSTSFKQYLNGITYLNRKMIIDFVKEIIVDNEKNIKIRFNFEDELKKHKSIFDKKTV